MFSIRTSSTGTKPMTAVTALHCRHSGLQATTSDGPAPRLQSEATADASTLRGAAPHAKHELSPRPQNHDSRDQKVSRCSVYVIPSEVADMPTVRLLLHAVTRPVLGLPGGRCVVNACRRTSAATSAAVQ